MTKQKRSICLALIHNNNAIRNAHIRPYLNQLQSQLAERYSANLIEVSAQSDIQPHGVSMAALRDAIYQMLDRGWRRYRRLPVRLLPLHVSRFVMSSVKKYSRGAQSWKRNSAVEMVVTDKHLRAWATFLDTSGDCLICFEDDAVFKSDSIDRLMALLDELLPSRLGSPMYVDLAGGCSLEALQIHNLEVSWDGSFRHYSKPVTNTACVYLLSRPLVTTFCGIIARRPWLRVIGIDWLMNTLLMQMANDGVKCACLHADPAIFKHGTTGEYVSWQAAHKETGRGMTAPPD
jgi:hypothetical protein